MAQQTIDKEAVALLRADHKGWSIELFNDKIKASTCLCANCNSVCCDAVELGCDHDDNDIYLYCHDCLKELIINNDNKCPINLHSDPVINLSRASRRQISTSLVVCPYSLQNKTQKNDDKINNDNDHVMDTMGIDEKEGNEYKNIESQSSEKLHCEWKGTLSDLINKHIIECSKKHNPSFLLNRRIHELQNQNKELNQHIIALQKEVNHCKLKNDQLQFQLNEKQNNKEEQKQINIDDKKKTNCWFKQHGKYFNVNNSIAMYKSDRTYQFNSIYSDIIMSKGQHIFKIKILKLSQDATVTIGVSSSTKHCNKPFWDWGDNNTYYVGYNNSGHKLINNIGHSEAYGPSFGESDVLDINLNLTQQTIEFSKNSQCLGIASNNIHKTEYRLVVCIFVPWSNDGDVSIEMISYINNNH